MAENRCGQLAVAIALERLAAGLGPGHGAAAAALGAHDTTMREPTAESRAALAEAIAHTHPPDVPFGGGTSAFRVRAALEDRGVPAHIVHSGWFGIAASQAWEHVARAASHGLPAIVCVDAGALGGTAWHTHWCVVTGISNGVVEIENPVAGPRVPVGAFRDAWACRHLPWPHHHCAVIPAAPPRPSTEPALGLATLPDPVT
jgi:hypothetical protein